MSTSTTDRSLARLDEIDARAQRLAQSVAKAPELREALREEAASLREELVALARELEESAPATRSRSATKISESLLDLGFVDHEGGPRSLRLAARMR